MVTDCPISNLSLDRFVVVGITRPIADGLFNVDEKFIKTTMGLPRLIMLICLMVPVLSRGQQIDRHTSIQKSKTTEWILSDLAGSKATDVRVLGNPQVITSPYGKALLFNGLTDGIFVEQMPLSDLERFTIELIMSPNSGGNFEQRYFHCGEVRGSRVLLELRSTKTDWYLDAFVKSGYQQKALIDSAMLHPLDQWVHVAFVVDNGKQETYVNGKKELESRIAVLPLKGGKTSIGVRQNEQSWFKGAIYKIRISPEALIPEQFLKF